MNSCLSTIKKLRIFQFLMVRLRDAGLSPDALKIDISIPSGAIKSGIKNLNSY